MLAELSQLEQQRKHTTKPKGTGTYQLKRKLNNKYIATWKFGEIYKNVYTIVMVKRKYYYMYIDSYIDVNTQAKVCSN